MLWKLLLRSLAPFLHEFSFGGDEDEDEGSPSYVPYQNILSEQQRGQGIETLFGQGAEFIREGILPRVRPTFDLAFDILQPFSEQLAPFTQATLREQRKGFERLLPYQEQAFQKAGAFFSPDFLKARGDLISEQSLRESDFLTKLMFGLTETGVGLGQNLLTLGLQAGQLGGDFLQNLLAQQFNVETANVNLENERRKLDFERQRQRQRQGSFGIGDILSSLALPTAFIPGIGPILSAGLSLGGAATSSFGEGGGGFGDFMSRALLSSVVGEQLGGIGSLSDKDFLEAIQITG